MAVHFRGDVNSAIAIPTDYPGRQRHRELGTLLEFCLEMHTYI